MLGSILIVVFMFLAIGALPAWSYSRDWGYTPTATCALVLAVVCLLTLGTPYL